MTGSRLSLSQIKREDHDLFNFISERALSIAKSSNSTNGTVLDTTHIQILEGVDFKNYIFKVVQDSTHAPDVLKNYMLVILKDSIQHQYMVTYPYVNQVIDTTNVVIEPVFGTDILNQVTLKCGGGSFQSVWVPGGYVDNPCIGKQKHTFSQGAACEIYWGKPGSASRIFYEGYFTTQYVEQQPCYTFDPGNPGNSGGGTPGYVPPPDDDDSDDDNEDQINISVGVTPNDGLEPVEKDKDCEKIKKVLKNTDTTAVEVKFHKKMKEMADSVGIFTNEVSLSMYKNDNNLVRNGGDQGSGRTSMPSSSSDFIAFYHIHNNAPGGTYSVFSYGDLGAFAERLSDINTGSFVAFLSTHHGTHYALSIKSANRFKDFFATHFQPTYFNSDTPIEIKLKKENHKRKISKQVGLILKYFENPVPLIDQTDTNTNNQLQMFLMFLEEANMGVELFETDKNFENFSKLSLENNNIKRKPC